MLLKHWAWGFIISLGKRNLTKNWQSPLVRNGIEATGVRSLCHIQPPINTWPKINVWTVSVDSHDVSPSRSRKIQASSLCISATARFISQIWIQSSNTSERGQLHVFLTLTMEVPMRSKWKSFWTIFSPKGRVLVVWNFCMTSFLDSFRQNVLGRIGPPTSTTFCWAHTRTRWANRKLFRLHFFKYNKRF